MTADVSVRITIRATSMDIWAAVADPRRITEWSPESSGVRCQVEGPLPVGTIFTGSNRRGLFRWSTRCVVVESMPGEAFAFDVTFLGMPDARWRYQLTEGPEGVVVEEQWWDHRGQFMKLLGLLGTGVADRATHNRRTMAQTLSALRADLEGS